MDLLIFLIPLSFMMGFVSSISGGGGVFGVPALLAFGVPPVNALVLNRASDLGHIVGSLKNYMNVGEFDYRLGMIAIPPILVGAFIGANLIVGVEEVLLNKIILCAVMVGVFLLLYPFKPKENKEKPYWLSGVAALFVLGLWDGAFAMAGGTFGVLIFVFLFHQSYLSAKGVLTFAAVPETIMTVVILYMNSTVQLPEVSVMFVASILGAFIGSKLAIKKGARFMKYAMAAMALVMASKVLLIDVLEII